MPVICTRNRNPSYQPITQRIPQKKQEENKSTDTETFRTFSVRASVTSSLSSNTSKFLVGTALPNSTAKERLSRRESETTQQSSKGWKEDYEKYVQSLDTGKEKKGATKKEKRVSIKPEDQSILSISPKLQELQQLHNQLTKSSYVPTSTTKVFQPRRPTIESIRLAIEQAKKETNKNMGTEDISTGVSLNDAATLTEKKKKKLVKKKKAPGSPNQSTGSSRASASSSAKDKQASPAIKKKVESDTLQLRMKMKATVKK
ncbi:unnamed protein product [Callosobruchus maculatus]|uniref:Uncharacterized protein n=1 Tax=Callosobruchus maculatus TaxID=64391 RepID=A0A653DWE4_CALMS|nr:unnamed protein product [Callosobruchus maculatus]